MRSDVNAILVGIKGRSDMLAAIFGAEDDTPTNAALSEREMTPELYDAVFG